MRQLPSGTVTFLFTDIEGSTRHWEEHRAWMEHAFARQEQIIREAAARHDGYVYKMIGDAFQIAFPTAQKAITAAAEAQRALQAEAWGDCGPLRVRMALHTGVAEERGDDYVGPALNRVARLLEAAHGGQVLVTQATCELIAGDLPPGITVHDLGSHWLKDLLHPEHIHQVNSPGLACLFPHLRSLEASPNNLPVQLTSFIGRNREIEQVRSLLRTSRLVTLTGAGGCGKTRLALQVAAELTGEYSEGVWLVELAPLADPELVPQTVADALRVRAEAGKSILEAVKHFMLDRRILLILDNCEHLIDRCAQVADALLQACPRLVLLATSREPLEITGEVRYRVPSLASPVSNSAEIKALAEYEAVRLFCDRAKAVQPSFSLTDENAPAVAQICRRLDGIPLAIELAAARVRVLSAVQIGERVDDRFRLLTGGSRTTLPRHQTLRALIDWSYGLLSEPERALLRRLSIFAGGCTLEATEAICGAEGISADEILDLLTRLVDKSMVIAEPGGRVTRYGMLETIRQYAREKLLESDEGEEFRSRHMEYFVRWAEHAEPQVRGPDQVEWLKRMELERENFRVALEWSQRPACEAEFGHRLMAALGWFWWLHGYFAEEKQWTERGIARGGEPTRAFAYVLAWWGVVATGEPGQLENARARLEESVALSRRLGDPGLTSWVLVVLGRAAEHQGDISGAIAFCEEGVRVSRTGASPWYIAMALERLGEGYRLAGDFDRAATLYEEALNLSRSINDSRNIGVLLHNLGHVLLQWGDLVQAFERFSASLAIGKEMGDERRIVMCLAGLAGVMVKKGELEKAAQLFGAAENLRQVIGAPWAAADMVAYETYRAALQEKEFKVAWSQGRAMTMEQAIAFALKESDA